VGIRDNTRQRPGRAWGVTARGSRAKVVFSMTLDPTLPSQFQSTHVTVGVVLVPAQAGVSARQVAITSSLTVGAAPAAGVVLAGRTVSRIHAELNPEADGVWVRDLGSKNGTYVNGVRVREARIPDGAKVAFGDDAVELQYTRAEPETGYAKAKFGEVLGASTAMLFNT
jgi:pSer/pThr/pTyr-binding forkhead associated (FHA) protein